MRFDRLDRILIIPFLLTIGLTILKVLKVIDWKWYWMFSPICIFGIFGILGFVIFLIIVVFGG